MNSSTKWVLSLALLSNPAQLFAKAPNLPDLGSQPSIACEISEDDAELVSRFEESYGAALDANWDNFIAQYSAFKRNFLNSLEERLENAKASVARPDKDAVDEALEEVRSVRALDVASEVQSGKGELKNSLICALVELPEVAKEKFLTRQGIDTAVGFTFFSISPAVFPKLGRGLARKIGVDIEVSVDAVMTIKSPLVQSPKGRFGIDFLATYGGGFKVANPPEKDWLDLRLLKDAFSLRAILNPKIYWRSSGAQEEGLKVADLDGVYNTTSVEFRLRRFARLKAQAGTLIGPRGLDLPLIGDLTVPSMKGVHFVSVRSMENAGEGTDASWNYKPYFETASFKTRAGQLGSLLMDLSGEATIGEFVTDDQFIGKEN